MTVPGARILDGAAPQPGRFARRSSVFLIRAARRLRLVARDGADILLLRAAGLPAACPTGPEPASAVLQLIAGRRALLAAIDRSRGD